MSKLVEIQDHFLKELFDWRNNSFTIEHNPLFPCDFKKFREIMLNMSGDIHHPYSGHDFKWMILENGGPIALVGMSAVNKMMKTAEIGYQVNPDHRGRGVGTKAVNDLVKHIFTNTDIRKLTALVADKNIPSCKILEKIGFKQEGLLRKHYLINGKEVDERIYGLLREEF